MNTLIDLLIVVLLVVTRQIQAQLCKKFVNGSFLENPLDFNATCSKHEDCTPPKWMPAIRKVPFGPYEFITADENYGKTCNIPPNNFSLNFFQKNCVICNGQVPQAEDCSRKHLLVCQESKTMQDEVLSQLFLTFDVKKIELYLLVYRPEGLSGFGTKKKLGVFCFTDASESLKKMVKLEEVYSYKQKTNDEYNFLVLKLKLEKYLGQYWCEGLSLNKKVLVSNKVLAYKKEGREYALKVKISQICKQFDCPSSMADSSINYAKFIDGSIKNVLSWASPAIRVMQVYNLDFEEQEFTVLYHLTSKKLSRSIFHEFYNFKRNLESLSNDSLEILFFRSAQFCLPENDWPLASLGQSVLSNKLCGQTAGSSDLYHRVCGGSFLEGTLWLAEQGVCPEGPPAYSTQFLQSLSENIKLQELSKLSQTMDKPLQVIEVYFLWKILDDLPRNLTQDHFGLIVDLFDNLLKNSQNLKLAQNLLNITDNFLQVFQEIQENVLFDQFFLMEKPGLKVFATRPFLTNFSGIALTQSDEVMVLERNSSQDVEDKLILQIPETIFEDLTTKFVNLSDVKLLITIFNNNHLFEDPRQNETVHQVVSISIPGYGSYLPGYLPIFFQEDQQQVTCAYWDFKQGLERKRGHWSSLGGSHRKIKKNLHSCGFSHLTHFALLIMEQDFFLPDVTGSVDDDFLDVVTLIGCCLTLFGTSGIFVTAAVFDDWRKRQGTQILLHISVAIVLEASGSQIVQIRDHIGSSLTCFFLGISIHYVVLSKFCWMLIYAFLQYFRFVKVLGKLPENLVLKSVVFGWGLPLFPVFIVILVSPESYNGEELLGFCYPKGTALYVAVLLPIAIVILTNFLIFCVVIYQVSNKTVESRHGHEENYRRQLQLATLLFFMLGLPYLFGLLARFITIQFVRMAFVYVFCLTATLQGFILFLFYVVFNQETRHKWKRLLMNKTNKI